MVCDNDIQVKANYLRIIERTIQNQNFWEHKLRTIDNYPYIELTIKAFINKEIEDLYSYHFSFTIWARFPQNYRCLVALIHINKESNSFNLRFRPARLFNQSTTLSGACFRSCFGQMPKRFFQTIPDCLCYCDLCMDGLCQNCCEY